MAMALASKEMQLGENLQSLEAEIVDVVLDNAYPTGGSAGFAAIVGEAVSGTAGPEGSSTGNIVAVIDLGPTNPAATTDHLCYYHPETDKLQVFWTGSAVSTAFTEVANTTNLSAFTHRFLVLARGL